MSVTWPLLEGWWLQYTVGGWPFPAMYFIALESNLQDHYKNRLTKTVLLINTVKCPPIFFMGLTEAFFVSM